MEEATQGLEECAHFFEVRTPMFEGPIDLLLQLVKSHELPIEKMSLAIISSQYLEAVEQMRGSIDLELAGEYLVIAATLLSIKAAVLLNEPVELVEDEDGNLVDPHAELLARLKEAAVYKEGAFKLSCLKLLGVDVFAPPSQLHEVSAFAPPLKMHDPLLLGKAFRRVLERLPKEVLYTIEVDSVTIAERMTHVLGVLESAAGKPVPFEVVVGEVKSRGALIGTFLALLELCKRQAITVMQGESFEQILIGRADHPAGIEQFDSEFDQLPTAAQE